MTLSDISDLSQMIAAIAVVPSLFYLANQTRLAAEGTKAVVHEHRLDAIAQHVDHICDPKFGPLFIAGAQATRELSDEELDRFLYFSGFMIMTWEERFRQRREGMLDAGRWRTSELNMARLLQMPGFRAAAIGTRRIRDPDFLLLLDRLIEHGRTTPLVDARASWRTSLAAELSDPQ